MAEDFKALILAIIANPNVRSGLTELLIGTDFALEFAETAQEGLDKAEDLLPAVVLLDSDPVLSPYETCHNLRSNRLLANLPLLMLADRENPDVRVRGLSAGVDDFLEKPFDEIEILARLRTISRLNTYRLLLADLTRFSWMVEHAEEGYLMLDQASTIHYANERAQQILNLADDYLGLPFKGAVEYQYTPQPAEVWENWTAEPESCFLVQPESPTARAAWVVLESLDTPIGVDYHRIVRLRDVTEKMSIYQDMRHFHTVVAHKLRTPMSQMYSNLSMIETRMELLAPEEIKDFVKRAMVGVDRLSKEIREILTFIDAPLMLNLGDPFVLHDILGLVRSISKSLNLDSVSIFLPEDLSNSVLALTPAAFEMILVELLENSRKFHPKHSPHVEITFARAVPGYLKMRVADDGLTLTPEQLSWAWLPYVQGEKDFTGELPGMGLGFPLVATLIWKAGGDLWMRNRPDGPGVVIQLTIPLEGTSRGLVRPAQPLTA